MRDAGSSRSSRCGAALLSRRLLLDSAYALRFGGVMKTSAERRNPIGTFIGILCIGAFSGTCASGGGPLGVYLLQTRTFGGYYFKAATALSLSILTWVAAAGLLTRLLMPQHFGDLHWDMFLLMIGPALSGVWFGETLSSRMSNEGGKRAFAVVLVFVAVYMIWKTKLGVTSPAIATSMSVPLNLGLLRSGSLLGGAGSKLFGMGGGVWFIPFLILCEGLSPNEAMATSLAVSIPMMGLGAYLGGKDLLDVSVLLPAVIGGAIGATVSLSIATTTLSVLLALVLIYCAVYILAKSVRAKPITLAIPRHTLSGKVVDG